MSPRAAAAVEASALGAVLVLQAVLVLRAVDAAATYDEGVYLASVDAWRAGERLGSEVFVSQPPGWYGVVRLSAAVFGDPISHVRLGMVALAILGSLAAALAVRAIGGPVAGVLAAAFLTVAPPIPLFAARVLSDLPSMELLFLSLAAAALGRAAGSPRGTAIGGVACGALFVAACSVKVSAIVALPALALLVPVRDRRQAARAAVGAAAAAAALLVLNAGALPDLWDSVVGYHRELRGVEVPSEQRRILVDDTLDLHAAFTWIAATAAVLSIIAVARTRRVPAAPYALLAALTFGFLLWHRPLFEHHLTIFSAALAVWAAAVIGTSLPVGPVWRSAVLGAVVLLACAGYVQQVRRVDNETSSEAPAVLGAAALLEARTPAGSTIVTDLPIVAYRARRLVPGNLVDSSFTRLASGSLTEDEIVASVREDCAAGVVIARTFATRPGLVARLTARFRTTRSVDGIVVSTGRRASCPQSSAARSPTQSRGRSADAPTTTPSTTRAALESR